MLCRPGGYLRCILATLRYPRLTLTRLMARPVARNAPVALQRLGCDGRTPHGRHHPPPRAWKRPTAETFTHSGATVSETDADQAHGGQSLGMRPWRCNVSAVTGERPTVGTTRHPEHGSAPQPRRSRIPALSASRARRRARNALQP